MEQIKEILITVDEYLNNLTGAMDILVEKINNGEEQAGIGLIPDIAEGMNWIIEAMKLTSNYTDIVIKDEEIDSKVSSVVEALENEDNILVSDLFNYELLPLFREIHQKIKMVL